jgi:hypothetical protein
MKRIGHTQHLLVLAVFLFAGLAQAQHARPLIKADIPFEFSVGKKTLPAGTYSIARAEPNTLVLRDARDRVVASVVAMPAQAAAVPKSPKLEFYRDSNGKHVLARVWPGGDRYGSELSSPKPASAMAKKQAGQVRVASTQP